MKTLLKRWKYFLGLGMGAVVVFSSFATTVAPQQRVLAADGVFISAQSISYNGQTFSGPVKQEGTGRWRYTSTTASVTCNETEPRSANYGKAIKKWDYIEFDSNPTAAGSSAGSARYTDWIDVNGQGLGTNCQYSAKNITLGNTDRATMTQAQGQCAGAQYNEREACINNAAQTICKNSGTGFDQCVAAQKSAIPPQGYVNSSTPEDTNVLEDPNADGSGSGDEQEDPDLNCGTTKSRLDWIICPVVRLTNLVLSGLDNMIITMLQVEPKVVDETDPKNPGANYYKAWTVFRNIALGLIVITALIMLISQALGFEIFDAYTVKKVMPRIVIAIIGTALSWQLMKWFVIFTNDLGLGVRSIILFPFREVGGGQIDLATGLIMTLIGAPVILGLGIVALLLFGASAMLALLIALLVLIARQLVIVVLLISAPIAIAAYVLPNTQSVWKLWHESFTKALLMFPIIMAFLAVGKAFAVTSSTDSSSVVGQLVGFIAYILPYFLLPLTFRFAGGAMRTIGGFANDKSRGTFDRLKKARGDKLKDRKARAASGHLYGDGTKLGKLNNIASWAASPGSNAAYKLRNVRGFKTAGARVASQIEHARVAQSTKLFEELNKAGYNDKAYRVLSGAHGQIGDGTLEESTQRALAAEGLLGKAPKNIQQLQRVAHILSGSTNAAEQIAGNAIEGSAGHLATLYKDPEMGKADLQAAGIMGLAAHGFATSDDLANVGNDLQGGKKEWRGYAQSVVSQAQVMGARSRPDIKAGYGILYEDGQFKNGITTDSPNNRADNLLDSLSAQDMAGAKGGAFKALAPAIEKALQSTSLPPNASKADRRKAANRATAVQDQLFQWASPFSSSSNDIKVQALQFIQTHGLGQAYERRAAEEAASRARTSASGSGQPSGGEGAGGGGTA